jgi:hypothetical protein
MARKYAQQAEHLKKVDQTWRAVKLRKAGASFKQTGDALGVSAATARKRVEEATQAVVRLTDDEIADLDAVRPPADEDTLRDAAYEMRIAGKIPTEIAAALGTDQNTVRRWLAEEEERRTADTLRDANSLRILHLARLEKLRANLWEAANDGQRDSLQGVLKILEMEARLQGLNEPERVVIESYIRQIADETGTDYEILRGMAREMMGKALKGALSSGS